MKCIRVLFCLMLLIFAQEGMCDAVIELFKNHGIKLEELPRLKGAEEYKPKVDDPEGCDFFIFIEVVKYMNIRYGDSSIMHGYDGNGNLFIGFYIVSEDRSKSNVDIIIRVKTKIGENECYDWVCSKYNKYIHKVPIDIMKASMDDVPNAKLKTPALNIIEKAIIVWKNNKKKHSKKKEEHSNNVNMKTIPEEPKEEEYKDPDYEIIL